VQMSAEGIPDDRGDEKDGDDRARRVRGRAADPAMQAAADVKRILADAAGLRQVVDLAEQVTMDGHRENGVHDGSVASPPGPANGTAQATPCGPDAPVSD
jgi:hypothetical protein